MSGRPFRFLQAGDMHLELSLHGLSEIPDHLKQTLIDAPLAAAEQVFETALAEQVDFVVLTGDVIHPEHAGPRAITFLVRQFERLNERGIPVYWAGGRIDSPGRWPSAIPLPENVHVFPKSSPEQVTQLRDDEPLVSVIGKSWSGKGQIRTANFESELADVYTVAVAHGKTEAEAVARSGIDYWALGGAHARETLCTSPCTAHYAGTPQGFSPDDTGPRGCTLAEVLSDGETRLRLVATDAVRWHAERIELPAAAGESELNRLLHDKLRAIIEGTPGREILVTWTVSTNGKLARPLRRGGLADELVTNLRQEFGRRQTAAWTVSLDVEPPRKLPKHWQEEETILGDFVRAMRDHQAQRGKSLDLASLLPDRHRGGPLAEALQLDKPEDREAMLHGAATLGVDLLRGGEPLSGNQEMPK
jgi:DNA repair exonuclease SbcCD nuclease subunit